MMFTCPFLVLFILSSVCLWGADGIEAKLLEEGRTREEKIKPLAQALNQGDKLAAQGELLRACEEVVVAIQNTPESLRETPAGRAARTKLSVWECRLAENESRLSHWGKAREWALRSLEHDPGNTNAQTLLADCEQMLGRGAAQGEKINPALSDRFFEKLKSVQTGLDEAEKLRETGQLREAEKRFEDVLALDPFNTVALEGIQKISKEKYLAAAQARDVANVERGREVREAWNNILPKKQGMTTGKKISGSMTLSPTAQLEQKLKQIIIPQVDFSGLDLETVRRALATLSTQYDDAKRGVNFVVSSDVSAPQPINLKLRQASLYDVVRYVAQIAGVKTRLSEIGVTFAPIVETRPDLISREFTVSPSFFKGGGSVSSEVNSPVLRGAAAGVEAVMGGGSGQNEQSKLEELGVKFPPGAFAVYNRSTGRLRVVNNAEMLDMIGQLIAAAEEETYLIQVGVRLVEINQVDLDSITINSTFGSMNPDPTGVIQSLIPQGLNPNGNGATPPASAQQGVSAQLNQIQGVGMLPNNTIQSFLQPGVLAGTNQTSSYALNTLQLGGSIMGGTQFRALLTAIAQKSSANVLASPTITLKRGQEGVIDVTQDFRYVKEYSDPQSSIATIYPPNAGAAAGIVVAVPGPETVIGSFPTQISDVIPIGVKLGVKPDITGDNSRVLMELKPSFIDFEGFINYGALVKSAYTARYFDEAVTILTNNIQQPVFVRRDVTIPAVEVSDGFTLMLGGLLREDIQNIDEKVPIIGDIPLLGRAFQGKTEQAIKKNTLIFVTPRILQVDGEYLNPTAGLLTSTATAKTPP